MVCMATLGRVRCAILGSRGLVAQRLLQRLVNHSWLHPVAVIGSPSTAGMRLNDLPWSPSEQRPVLPELTVREIGEPQELAQELISEGIRIVFSALPEGPAAIAEEALASAGLVVISHSIIHRLEGHIPLIIPEVNANHLELLDHQNQYEGGKIVSCSGCMTVPLAITLSPLDTEIGVDRVRISTEQSLSGGGRDMLAEGRSGTIFSGEIDGESGSVIDELLRILGKMELPDVSSSDIDIEASCKRVNREYGHLARVEVLLQREVSAHEVIRTWSGFKSRAQELDLPSACLEPIHFVENPADVGEARWVGGSDRSPSEDLRAAMAVAVGDIQVSGRRLTYTTVADNTIRGAAGYSVLIAELMLAEGIIHDSNTLLSNDPESIGEMQ